MIPKLISGGRHTDDRGTISFNNAFDLSAVKRMYSIENESTAFIRAWQGHAIEKRWFSAIQGQFEIKLIEIENWDSPNKSPKVHSFILKATTLDVLCVSSGYVSSIKALEEHSKLLAMSDYLLGEVNDEYRFDRNYFKI